MTGDGKQQKVRFPALLTFVTSGVKYSPALAAFYTDVM